MLQGGVGSNVVLGNFLCGISVVWVLKYSNAVLTRPLVCGFQAFWLTAFGKNKYFPWYSCFWSFLK